MAAAALILLIAGLRHRMAQQTAGERDPQASHDAAAKSVVPVQPGARPTPSLAKAIQTPEEAPPAAPDSKPATPFVRRPVEPAPAVMATDGSALDAELALLRSARESLARGASTEALGALAEHERRFAAGHLVEERMLLRVQALCETGLHDQARAAAGQFVREHPNSPHAVTVTSMCRE